MRQDPAINYVDDKKSDIVAALIARDGDICFYCPEPFSGDSNDKFGRTIDHYHSVDWCKRQGLPFLKIHGMENLVLAHKACNSKKSNRAWLDDGTLEPRARDAKVHVERVPICDTCMTGRLLYPGEFCHVCGVGARPSVAPAMLQRRPSECDHSTTHCWGCHIGIIPRKRAMEDVFGVKPGTENNE